MPARQASPPPERPPEAKSSSPGAAATPAVTPSSSWDAANNNNDNDIYQHSNYVYILDSNYSWIPAQVTNRTKHGENQDASTHHHHIIHVSIPQYKSEQAIQCDGGRTARSFKRMEINMTDPKNLAKYPSQHLPLQNVNNEGELQVVEDMVDLPFLHEVSEIVLVGKVILTIDCNERFCLFSLDVCVFIYVCMYRLGRHFVQLEGETCEIIALYSHWRYNISL
jgi:hypothetical protein